MSSIKQFLKGNKKIKGNAKYAATTSLTDENGKPLEWEIRPLTSKENDTLIEECTIDVPVTGKPNMFRQKFKNKEYVRKMVASSVVFPDLYDKELQDSYGVMEPEDLLVELVDDPGEYNKFTEFVSNLNGFTGVDEKADIVKN